MPIPFQTLAQDSVLQIRDAMRRVTQLHAPLPRQLPPAGVSDDRVQLPKPDAVVWADTEIDVRRVLL